MAHAWLHDRQSKVPIKRGRCTFSSESNRAIGTDHHLFRSKIKLHLKCKKKKNRQQLQLRLDRSKLENEVLVKRFQSELEKNLAESKKYTKFVKHIRETAEDYFQPDQGSQRRRKEWMTDESLEIIEKNSLSYLTWQNHRGTPSERNTWRKYVALRKLVKNMVDRRQTEYWDEISLEIETAIQQHDPATAFATIRRLRGGKQRVNWKEERVFSTAAECGQCRWSHTDWSNTTCSYSRSRSTSTRKSTYHRRSSASSEPDEKQTCSWKWQYHSWLAESWRYHCGDLAPWDLRWHMDDWGDCWGLDVGHSDSSLQEQRRQDPMRQLPWHFSPSLGE